MISIDRAGRRVPVRVVRIEQDFHGIAAGLGQAGMKSPTDAVSGAPLCVKLPCWRNNAQITPLAHYMQVLSFHAKDGGIENVFHTNEHRSFSGIEGLFGSVAYRPDLIFGLRECISERQRASLEMVCEDTQLLFLKEGVMVLNPPRKMIGSSLADEFAQFSGVEERYCTIVLPTPRSHHERFEEAMRLEEMLLFANIYAQSRWDASVYWVAP